MPCQSLCPGEGAPLQRRTSCLLSPSSCKGWWLERACMALHGQSQAIQPGSPARASLTFFLFQGRITLPFSLCVRIFFKDLIALIYLKILLDGWLHWAEGTLMTFIWLKELFGKEGFAVIPKYFWMPISFNWKLFFSFLFYLLFLHIVCEGFFGCFLLSLDIRKHVCMVSKMVK